MANYLKEMIELFGYQFQRKESEIEKPSFAPAQHDDGAITVAPSGAFGTYIDLDGTVRTEAELITRYRDMTLQPECDAAIDEIVNESISIQDDDPVKLVLDDLEQPAQVKKIIEETFKEVLQLIDFNQSAYDIYRRWYIDGRLYFHAIIDEKNPSAGMQEVRYIDPRKIRKVREVIKKKVRGGENAVAGDAVITQVKNEYYIYTDRGFNVGNKITGPSTSGLKISKDAIVYVTSGITDSAGSMVLSYMHKAIKPLNQLRVLEDASIIYRLSRAPERRVWQIEVGGLPKMKAEQYVRDVMTKHKNRLIYDSSTGEVKDDRKFQTMLEDFWLPMREGKGNQVTTLPPGTNFNQLDDILFFQKKLYRSLNVPISRLDPDNAYNVGVATEITRDELKFAKFINRLQTRFSILFTRLLEKQLVLKGIMSIEDFQRISKFFRYEFTQDSYTEELKEQQILTSRMQLVMSIMPLVGRYYSNMWVRKKLLRQDDDDIEKMDMEIAQETMDPQYNAMGEMGPGAMGTMVDSSAVDQNGAPQQDNQQQQPNSKVGSAARKLSKGT